MLSVTNKHFMLSVFLLNVVMLRVAMLNVMAQLNGALISLDCFDKYCIVWCHYAKCLYAECHYAECHYA
jgi:hypothetical protein